MTFKRAEARLAAKIPDFHEVTVVVGGGRNELAIQRKAGTRDGLSLTFEGVRLRSVLEGPDADAVGSL